MRLLHRSCHVTLHHVHELWNLVYLCATRIMPCIAAQGMNPNDIMSTSCVTEFYPKLKSFGPCSHMNCCLHYMLHINLHILYIYFFNLNLNLKELHINLHILYILFIKTNLNLKEFQLSNKYFKSYQENKIEFLDEFYSI